MSHRSLRLTGAVPGTGTDKRTTTSGCTCGTCGLPKRASAPAAPARVAAPAPAPQATPLTPITEGEAVVIRDRLLKLNSDAARNALRLLYAGFPHLQVAGDQIQVPAPSVENAIRQSRSAAVNSVREIAGVPAKFDARLPEAEEFIKPYAIDGHRVAPPAPSLEEAIKKSRGGK